MAIHQLGLDGIKEKNQNFYTIMGNTNNAGTLFFFYGGKNTAAFFSVLGCDFPLEKTIYIVEPKGDGGNFIKS